jgi:hypothetical protein
MAAVLGGLTVYELAALGAAGITALFFTTPQGRKASEEAAKELADRLQRIRDSASEPTPEPEPPQKPGPAPVPVPTPDTNCDPDKPKDDDYCRKLYESIKDLTDRERPPPGGGYPQGAKGLKQRWRDHACNSGNWSPGGSKAVNHLNEYIKQRDALNKKLTEWNNSRCKKKGYKLPPEAEKYADPTKAPDLGSKVDIDGNPLNCK